MQGGGLLPPVSVKCRLFSSAGAADTLIIHYQFVSQKPILCKDFIYVREKLL